MQFEIFVILYINLNKMIDPNNNYKGKVRLIRFLRRSNIKYNPPGVKSPTTIFADPMYNESTSRLEMSCFQTQSLSEQGIINLSFFNSIFPNKKCPFAFCEINSDELIKQTNLLLDFNNKPNRHVDIINWPINKEEKKVISLKLAKLISSKEIVIFNKDDYLD